VAIVRTIRVVPEDRVALRSVQQVFGQAPRPSAGQGQERVDTGSGPSAWSGRPPWSHRGENQVAAPVRRRPGSTGSPGRRRGSPPSSVV